MGKEADSVDRHMEDLSSADPKTLEAAAEALARLDDPCAVVPLIRALGDESAAVRAAAARSLGRLGDEQAIEPLIQALRDWRGSAGVDASEALVKLGSAAVEPLVAALQSGSVYIPFARGPQEC